MYKDKYHFNNISLKYEKIKLSFFRKIILLSINIVMIFVLSYVFIIIQQYYYDTPNEIKLKKHIQNIELNYNYLNEYILKLNSELNELKTRDNEIYKSIFSISIDNKLTNQELDNQYCNLIKESDYQNYINNIRVKIEKISKSIDIQLKSYYDISNMIEQKKNMTNSIPAIQPISNKNLKRIASGYGLRMHPVYKIYKMHYGVDFVAPTGTKIYSTGNGIIKDININRSYGLCVVINHGYGYKTLYAHMSKVIVRKNQIVNRGDIIGLVGNSGLSTGSHLHYEVYKNGKNVDPALFFFNDISPDQYDEMIKVSKKFPLSFD